MSLSTEMPSEGGPTRREGERKAAAPSTKYLFEMSFDAEQEPACDAPPEPVPEPEELPPPLPPTFTEDDLTQACAAAQAQGEAAGRQAATAEFETRADQLLETLVGQVNDMIARQRETHGELAEQAVGIAVAAARKSLPQLARRGGITEIEEMVREILGGMLDEPRVVIRVADGVLDDLRARVDTISQRLGFQGSIVLLADPDMGPADCRIDWADGGAEHMVRHVWDDIDAAVKRVFDDRVAEPSAPAGNPT